MIISKVEYGRLTIPFHQPLAVAIGEMVGADNVIVKVTTDDGIEGWGEASPAPYITGDSAETNFETARSLSRLVLGKDPLAINARMSEIRGFTRGEPSIRSAFDMALHDIAAKTAGMPLYQFLGGAERALRTDCTIGLQESVEETVAKAQEILDAGFDAIKLKVGRSGLEDTRHVNAVRELAGPDISIKIDSNQGWDLPNAIANIEAMAELKLEYSEQPLPHWDVEGLATLRRKVSLPICADESVFDHHDALKLIRAGAVDYLNIKLGKSGGINTALKINAIAEAAGTKCMIGCFGESRLGLTAAAHLAMAFPNIAFIDLDSAFSFRSDPVIGGMTYDPKVGGRIHLTDAPGLGASFDDSVLSLTEKL